MHMNRVAYCDLKVDNMLIVGGRLKFSDFDTSILLDEQPLQII